MRRAVIKLRVEASLHARQIGQVLVENRSEPASRHRFAEGRARGVGDDGAVGRPGGSLLWERQQPHFEERAVGVMRVWAEAPDVVAGTAHADERDDVWKEKVAVRV